MSPSRRAFLVQGALALASLASGVGGLARASHRAEAATPARADDLHFTRIGTGRTGGAYFPVGGLIASAISNPPGSRPCEKGGACGVPGLIAVAQSTGGSVDNLGGLGTRVLDFAICQADVAYAAFRGSRVSDGVPPLPGLRAIGTLYTESLHLVTRADAGITDLAALKGRKVSLGDPGSGTLASVRLMLKAVGLPESALVASFDAPAQSADRLAEGSLDAFFFFGGEPVALVSALRERFPITLTPLSAPGLDRLVAQAPYLTEGDVAAGTYGNPDPVPTLQVGAVLVTLADLDPLFIESITAALWHPRIRGLYQKGPPQMRAASPERAVQGTAVPLHPGALRYYRRAGILERAGPMQF
ncbi:TAXI family TRAP transporter solute-binding subunit [Pararhodospirillum oryzae]|uniref:C4-dicarboxylate ABC transporter substrate-binding protein n=1 Tax=Pararhodospirillum oryzae TaxID=478448 RepID=A0A512HBK8_9PROT|nr:TAXI family TRAP transporter solute-binding subunit [Pararhodospirillum oryzae]GEO82831.1 C4-dicarboxylate ABC transporter substrate-binding protein [Pararhodospirillum oryzae]